MVDLYEIADVRRTQQKLNNEDINSLKYIPFDKKYKLRALPEHLGKLIEFGENARRNEDVFIIPEYQRDLVWSLENKQNLIFSIMNGSPIGEFIFVRETVDTKKEYYHRWIIVDGQQRLNALKEFVNNDFADKDGRYYVEYSYREMVYFFEEFSAFKAVYIQDLPEKEQIEIYLSKNVGGVAHTEAELQKAKDLLKMMED